MKYAFLLTVILLMNSCKSTTKESKGDKSLDQPNFIIIMADDQGWGDLGSSGNKNIQTPNIDQLGLEGASFENFYVQPVCSPTRAELLTGIEYPKLGVYDTSAGGERMNLGPATIAEVLQKAGYATAAYGKWHNGMQPPYHPNSRGFEDYYGFTSGHWGNYFGPMLEHNGKLVKGEGYLVDDLTNHGIAFMEEHKDEPFFLYLPLNTPHSPMQVPDAYWNAFKDKNLVSKFREPQKEDELFTKAALAMVSNIDDNVGRIMEKLDSLQLSENTIVIYLSDNGPNSYRYNGGMRGRKGSVDEGGVRSPFYVRWPNRIKKGKKVKEIAGAIDLMPTITKIINNSAKPKTSFDGKDLSPLLLEDGANWEDRLLYHHWNGKTSVRSQKYRLDDENRLYDIEADRGQNNDISQEYPEVTAQLKKQKENWLKSVVPSEKDDRPFTLGYSKSVYTQLPARDGIPSGNIKRSNRWPNDSFFTNWTSEKDSISWDVEVLSSGTYVVEVYYTCGEEAIGSTLSLSHAKNKISQSISKSHDPPLIGREEDRVPRMESYVKDFIPLSMGKIELQKGRSTMSLKLSDLNAAQGPDIRLLLFEKMQ